MARLRNVVLTHDEWKRLNDRIAELSRELETMREGIKLLGSIDRVLKFLDRERIALTLDPELTAQQHCRNEDYYRGLVIKIGEMLGSEAYISDDGSVQEEVLCAKVPELVAKRLSVASGEEKI